MSVGGLACGAERWNGEWIETCMLWVDESMCLVSGKDINPYIDVPRHLHE